MSLNNNIIIVITIDTFKNTKKGFLIKKFKNTKSIEGIK